MKRSGSPHPPRAGHHEDDNSTSSTSSATDAVCEPPAALRIAATAGAPPGAASVYQYVDENARAIAPAEELGEPALALSLLLIGQLEKLCSLPRPESDLIRSFVVVSFSHFSGVVFTTLLIVLLLFEGGVHRTQRELSGLAERYPFLVQNELMTQVLTWFLRPEYRSAQNAHRGDSALVWVAASVAHAGYFGAGGSSSSSDRRRRALPCEYVRAYALDMLGDRFWTGPAGAGGGLGERIGDVLGGKLAPPWLYAPDRAAWDAAVGDTLAAVLRDHRAHARTPAQHRAGLKVLARGLAFAPCRLLLAALLDGDGPSTTTSSSTSSSSSSSTEGTAATGRRVEWAYCFDVHCNGFFPLFLALHVGAYLVAPLLLARSIGPVATLMSNALCAGAAVHYCYVTFLGYQTLGTLRDARVFLLPVPLVVVAALVASLLGVNVLALTLRLVYH